LKAKGGEPLLWFEVAGKDHRFQPAEARIDGDTVLASSRKVSNPVAVRYAFSWISRCNLYNLAGLPASPFRTDDWPEAGSVH
jgi:sialate O-acetylesterase